LSTYQPPRLQGFPMVFLDDGVGHVEATSDRQVACCSPRRQHRPCRARPADRSLVAEDRSAGGVRDRTGPEPPMLTRLLTGRAVPPRDERVQDGTTLGRPPSVEAW
jgi:hypothetical protein